MMVPSHGSPFFGRTLIFIFDNVINYIQFYLIQQYSMIWFHISCFHENESVKLICTNEIIVVTIVHTSSLTSFSTLHRSWLSIISKTVTTVAIETCSTMNEYKCHHFLIFRHNTQNMILILLHTILTPTTKETCLSTNSSSPP